MMIFGSPRLYTRQFTMDDFEDFYVLNNDADVVRYIRDPQNKDQAKEFLKEKIKYYEEFPWFGSWAIIEKPGDRIIGVFMLKPSAKVEGRMEAGYSFLKPFWGKGYATEILKAGLQYAFLQLHIPSVIAITHRENVSSQRVLLKCGFTPAGDLQEEERIVNLFSIENPLVVVETARLFIIPLQEEQLYLYLLAEGKLEKKLLITDNGRTISADVKELVTRFTLPNMKKAERDNYLFFTFWIVVEKGSRTIVAELGFKGTPGKKGDIEIGYGTMPAMKGKGYMTEALGGMIGWAGSRPDVQYILAETEDKNIASIRVVQKNNFHFLHRKGKMLWWRAEVK